MDGATTMASVGRRDMFQCSGVPISESIAKRMDVKSTDGL